MKMSVELVLIIVLLLVLFKPSRLEFARNRRKGKRPFPCEKVNQVCKASVMKECGKDVGNLRDSYGQTRGRRGGKTFTDKCKNLAMKFNTQGTCKSIRDKVCEGSSEVKSISKFKQCVKDKPPTSENKEFRIIYVIPKDIQDADKLERITKIKKVVKDIQDNIHEQHDVKFNINPMLFVVDAFGLEQYKLDSTSKKYESFDEDVKFSKTQDELVKSAPKDSKNTQVHKDVRDYLKKISPGIFNVRNVGYMVFYEGFSPFCARSQYGMKNHCDDDSYAVYFIRGVQPNKGDKNWNSMVSNYDNFDKYDKYEQCQARLESDQERSMMTTITHEMFHLIGLIDNHKSIYYEEDQTMDGDKNNPGHVSYDNVPLPENPILLNDVLYSSPYMQTTGKRWDSSSGKIDVLCGTDDGCQYSHQFETSPYFS